MSITYVESMVENMSEDELISLQKKIETRLVGSGNINIFNLQKYMKDNNIAEAKVFPGCNGPYSVIRADDEDVVFLTTIVLLADSASDYVVIEYGGGGMGIKLQGVDFTDFVSSSPKFRYLNKLRTKDSWLQYISKIEGQTLTPDEEFMLGILKYILIESGVIITSVDAEIVNKLLDSHQKAEEELIRYVRAKVTYRLPVEVSNYLIPALLLEMGVMSHLGQVSVSIGVSPDLLCKAVDPKTCESVKENIPWEKLLNATNTYITREDLVYYGVI